MVQVKLFASKGGPFSHTEIATLIELWRGRCEPPAHLDSRCKWVGIRHNLAERQSYGLSHTQHQRGVSL